MGFYGNLTNTARTQFQFDRIYPNRYSMERNIEKDGVYLGRYVLIEYDADIHEDNIKVVYWFNKRFFGTKDTDSESELVLNKYTRVPGTVTSTEFAQHVYYVEEQGFHYRAANYDPQAVYYTLTQGNPEFGVEEGELIQTRLVSDELTGQFWKCVGSDEHGIALFEEITDNITNNFLLNYNLDISHFGPRQPEGAYSRAWDSTVWQKIYAQGEIKYIMIAELNAAAPSFSIAVDPPTQTPLAPHVDASSNNNIYQVHFQPTWGFRIKEEPDEDLSDTKVFHINSVYDAKTNQINEIAKEVLGAIYLNKKGFDIIESTKDESPNYITIAPTGQSGSTYNNHSGYFKSNDTHYVDGKTYYRYDEDFKVYRLIEEPSAGSEITGIAYEYGSHPYYDVNELEVHVPAIGNSVANFYDLIYGVNKENHNKRYRDTVWKYYTAEGRETTDINLGGATYDRATFAGTLNYLHQLEGMILYKLDNIPTEEEVQNLSSDFIYCILSGSDYGKDRYFYRHQTYTFDLEAVSYVYELVDKTTESYIPNCYFTLSNGEYVPDLGQSSYSSTNYYKRLLGDPTYTEVGYLVDYKTDKYYYHMGNDYLLERNRKPTENRDYYACDPLFKYTEIESSQRIYDIADSYYIDLSMVTNPTLLTKYANAEDGLVEIGWFETTDTVYSSDKVYYVVNEKWRLEPYTGVVGEPFPAGALIVQKRGIPPVGYTTVANLNETDISDGVYYKDNTISFRASYSANHWWYFDKISDDGHMTTSDEAFPVYDYLLDSNATFTAGRAYYYEDREPARLYNPDFYRANKYIYFADDDGTSTLFQLYPDMELEDIINQYGTQDDLVFPTEGRHYWKLQVDYSRPMWVYYNGRLILSYGYDGCSRVNILSISGQFRQKDPNTGLYHLDPPEPVFNYYYKLLNEDRYHMLYNPNDGVLDAVTYQFYTLENLDRDNVFRDNDFYIANKYYYIDNGDILLCSNVNYDTSIKLYSLSINSTIGILDIMSPVKFYEQSTYYYLLNSEYFIDNNAEATSNRIYYKKDILRVYDDQLGYCAKGMPWSDNIPVVPCTITLGKTDPWYELIEIGDVDTGSNSINGVILKYNQMLSENDRVTRETNTLQGILNLYSDIINRVDTNVQANKLITSDMYGRFTTTNYSIDDVIKRITQLENRVTALGG